MWASEERLLHLLLLTKDSCFENILVETKQCCLFGTRIQQLFPDVSNLNNRIRSGNQQPRNGNASTESKVTVGGFPTNRDSRASTVSAIFDS